MQSRGTLRVAAYLILCQANKVLLLKRHNTGYEDGNYSFIAGHVEIDESPTQAIIREASEEAGINIARHDLRFIQVAHRKCPDGLVYVDYFFVTDKWTGQPRIIEPDKCSALDWFPLDKLPSNIISYIGDVLDRWQRATGALNEFGW